MRNKMLNDNRGKMKLYRFCFVFAFSIISLSCKSQESTSRIEIIQPSVEQEVTSIWRTINDITFLEKQGYRIYLPKDKLIDSLIVKSKKGAFGNEDFPAIFALVENNLFSQNNYEQATQKVAGQMELIKKFLNKIDSTKGDWDWAFKTFNKYKIIFTLYGTGGSYDPDEGTITLLTNEDGNFINYKNPANTIIHEITHMGMEYSIVQKYNLPHGLKERIVDRFVYLMFKEELPEYRIQKMGDSKIDNHLRNQQDLGSLGRILSEFLK